MCAFVTHLHQNFYKYLDLRLFILTYAGKLHPEPSVSNKAIFIESIFRIKVRDALI